LEKNFPGIGKVNCDEPIMDKALQKYIRKFSKLRQGVTKYGPAPHKPVLLLSVLRGAEEGWIAGNRIELTPELVGTFKSIWRNLVTTGHSPLIAQPFFYMRGEKFWHHIPNPGFEQWVRVTRNCQAIGVLHKAVSCVQLDPDLFALIVSPAHRAVLRQTLLQTYFPNAKSDCWEAGDYWDQVVSKVMEEPSTEYAAEIRTLQEQLDKDSFEEEIFVRGGVFKRQVPLVYNNTCCISGLRVENSVNASLIDACHILPFSQSHDDTISNGIALCPTLHRAFDRGLVAIEPDRFTVLVSDRLSEPVESVYSIRQFHGRQITFPDDSRWRPGRDNLSGHLQRFAENF
jgi:putative restriction endonuclease